MQSCIDACEACAAACENAQKSVKENKAWNSAKSFEGLAPMPAANVQRNAGI